MIENQLNFLQPHLQAWENPVFAEKKLQVSVLRLDQMHPQLGGNKWMKLRFFLQKALAENTKGILTKGGPWSNHIHAAAWACQVLQLPLHVWVKGNEKMQTAMLADVQQWGTTVRYINRELFYNENAAQQFAEANHLTYIPMGGAEKQAVMESSRFLQQLHLPQYQYAACAVGTATTMGGLAFVPDNFTNIIGIDCGTNDKNLNQLIKGWQQSLPNKKLELMMEFGFGGFAKRFPELIQFANDLYLQQNIPTDMVYTAKLFFGILEMAKTNQFPENTALMVLHSGGLQGNRSLPAGTLQF